MKKRLLSAALALAMVLTLLPVSAFAAVKTPISVTYYTTAANPTNSKITADGWYQVTTTTASGTTTTDYTLKNSGVVTATGAWTNGTTGSLYTDAQSAIDSGASSFKLVGGSNTISDTKTLTTLTVDLNGNALTWSATISSTTPLTSLTFNNTDPATQTNRPTITGCITAGSNAEGSGKDLNVTLDHVVLAATNTVTIYNTSTSVVTLKDAVVPGAVTIKGVGVSATNTTATGGKVEVSGSTGNAQGGISVTQTTGGQVVINEGSATNGITVVSASGGDIDVTSASQKINAIVLKGYNTTLDINASAVGEVTVFGTTDAAQKSQKAAAINVSGYNCVVDSIKKTTGDGADALTSGVTLSITQTGNVKAVELPNAAITVNNGAISTSLKLGNGTVSLGEKNAIRRSSLGTVELGSNDGGAVSVTLYEQGNSSVGAVTEAMDNEKTITVTIPAHPTNPSMDNNSITSITPTDLTKWTKYTIAGGAFTTPISADTTNDFRILLNSGLLYQETKGGKTTYWPSERIDELVAYWGGSGTEATIIGTGMTTGDHQRTVTLYKGGDQSTDKAFEFKYNANLNDVTIQMPKKVGGLSIVEWNQGVASTATWSGGQSCTLPSTTDTNPAAVNFYADTLGYTITKVSDVAVPVGGSNPGVQAKLVGNTIQLSGPVSGVMAGQNTATIDLRLKTDAGNVDVKAAWVPSTNSLTFSSDPSSSTNGSMRLADSGKSIQLTVNNVKYTLQNSGLTVEAVGLDFDGNTRTDKASIVASSTVYTGTNAKYNNDKLAEAMSGGEVDFSGSPAVLEAFGASIAGINKAQVDSWRTTAQNQAFRTQQNTTTDPTTQSQREATGYSKVVAVLYMDVRVSQWSDGATPGSLTAVMAPYMRVEVRHSTDAQGTSTAKNTAPIVVRTGQPLRALNSEVGTVSVKLPVGDSYTVTGNVAHQNSTYVYTVVQTNKGTGPNPDPAQKTADFAITHAAANGSGFGTIVLNAVSAPVELKKLNTTSGAYEHYSPAKLYDTIQAAVDDSVNGDQVEVLSPMNQNVAVTMSGDARTISIDTHGNATITNGTSSNVVFVEKTAGIKYTIQLTRDTAKPTTPTKKPIAISVASVTGGSASLSASSADEGDTITVTLTPATGYVSSGITVRTDKGTTVSVSGSGNRYSFVVPKGLDVKSITVTPAFTRVNTNATVTVSNPAVGGTAVTSAGSSQVAPGTTVTVTATPATGYRTMGLYVTNATATRTGANTFSFTVPSGVTNVVVTPRFDRNNGTLFEDVWSTDYFSNAVGWAVGRGITNGDGSVYRFGTGKSCTREDMVTFLWRNAGSPVVTDVRNPFWDVQVGSYYYNAVMWAVKNGITNGVSATQFGVGQPVTRAQAVTFLYRSAGSPAAGTNSGFYDVPSSEYYAKAVSWAVGKGITNGDGSTVKFSPNGYCLREQIVTFMYRNATGTRA